MRHELLGARIAPQRRLEERKDAENRQFMLARRTDRSRARSDARLRTIAREDPRVRAAQFPEEGRIGQTAPAGAAEGAASKVVGIIEGRVEQLNSIRKPGVRSTCDGNQVLWRVGLAEGEHPVLLVGNDRVDVSVQDQQRNAAGAVEVLVEETRN